MKVLLNKMQIMEQKLELAQQQSEYWLEEEHFNEEKSEKFEQEADVIYEELYQLFNQAAEKIISITAGQIDKSTAMSMIRCRRSDVERIFARR